MGNFFIDFFFGPCLDNKAADSRQNQPLYEQRQQQQQQQQQQQHLQQQQQQQQVMHYSQPQHQQQALYQNHSSHDSNNIQHVKRPSSSKHLTAIPENESQRRFSDDNGLRRSTSSRHNNANGNNATNINGGNSSRPHGHHQSYTRRYKSAASHNDSAISSLSDSFNGKRHKRAQRRDDVSVMSASLHETYRGYTMTEDEGDYLDEQSAIRRSLKDNSSRNNKSNKKGSNSKLQQHIGNGHNNQHKAPSDAMSQSSNRTELETWLEGKGKSQSNRPGRPRNRPGADDQTDYDNVTTISKASKNPYRVLGISQGATPREIYGSYKKRMRETEKTGGSDKAFVDVGNAYRRIKADIKRQEARKERRRVEEQGGEGQPQSRKSKSRRNSKKSKRRTVESDEESDAKSRRENIDARLKDHRELVQGLFAKDNAKSSKRNKTSSGGSVSSRGQVTTLQDSVQSQSQALSEMNLVPVEGGAANINERNQTIQNSCFYLSLAASYLSGVGAFLEDPTASYYLQTQTNNNSGSGSVATVEMEIATLPPREKQLTMNLALQLKRAIEAAVLLVHPDWAQSGMVGEEVQAFSDFLVYALDSDSVLGHWAIAVFDEASGFVDVYRGRHYGKAYPPTKVKRARSRSRGSKGKGDKGSGSRVKYKYKDCDDATRRANTLTLRYIPGHYQPLLPELTKIANERRAREQAGGVMFTKRPTLEDVLATLERWNVLHVVTDGRA